MMRVILNKSWMQLPPPKQRQYGLQPANLQIIQGEQTTWGTGGEIKTNSWATFSDGLLHMDVTVLAE